MINQFVSTLDILSRNLDVLSTMVYAQQTSLEDILGIGDDANNVDKRAKEFTAVLDDCKYRSSVIKVFINQWDEKIPTLNDVVNIIIPVINTAFEVYTNAVDKIPESTSNEFVAIDEVSKKVNKLVIKIHTIVNLIEKDYGPITDFSEITTALEPYYTAGLLIQDFTIPQSDYEAKLKDLAIINHKLCALVQKLEQGGFALCKEIRALIRE